MPTTYSMDLRERVVKAFDAGNTPDEVAEIFLVSRSWVYRLIQKRQEKGTIEPNLSGRTGRPPKFPDFPGEVRRLVEQHPDATVEELRSMLPFEASASAIFKVLRKEGIVLKKSRLRP